MDRLFARIPAAGDGPLSRREALHPAEVEGADHSFHVLKRSGKTDAEVLDELADTIEIWTGELV